MNQSHLLVVDPDPHATTKYQKPLDSLGAKIAWAAEGLDGLNRLRGGSFDLALIVDVPSKIDALAWLREAHAIERRLPIVILVTKPTVEAATQAFHNGAKDFLTVPLKAEELLASVQRILGERRIEAEYDLLRRQIERPYSFDDMIGGCAAMRRVFETIEQVAGTEVDVLVQGETGTGKELVARSIHQRSSRAQGPFAPVDCGAIPETLLESEFFGHEKGTFTGADSRRIGLLEFADHGTFFLDELGEPPLVMQAKLLRTLQERRIRRVGGREEIEIDVRVVAATARSLENMIRQGQFRQDLYYRINVVRIDLPPLRERGDDIGLLAEYACFRYSRAMGRDVRGITPEAYQVLAQYRWPGNVRELQNVIRRGIALTKEDMITLDDLPDELIISAGDRPPSVNGSNASGSAHQGFFAQRETRLQEFEHQYFSELLSRHHGDVRAAAGEALLPRGTLYRLLKKHGLESAKFR